MQDHIPVVADFHIQASPQAAALPKLVLKRGESFLVSDRHGDFPAHFDGELGFYHAGTRYLRWLELRVNGERPLLLGAEIAHNNDGIRIALTNSDLQEPTGVRAVPRNTLHLDREVTLSEGELLHVMTLASFHDAPCELTLELLFNADFRDVFEVRGMHRAERGELLAEDRDGTIVRLRYRGLDAIVRTTELAFDPPPLLIAASRAVYRVGLAPGARRQLRLAVTAGTAEPRGAGSPAGRDGRAALERRAAASRLEAHAARISTDNEAYNTVVARSLADLDILLTDTPQGRVPYAGVPWYVAAFGRDSIITSLQLLPYYPEAAAGTLRFLATWQGRTDDAFRDEEPGKILHEYRHGEMANCREIPFVPYYGAVDATPLFLVLLHEYVRWTGDLGLARELWPAAQAALGWLHAWGDGDGDGYLEYATRSPLGLTNQGWKDSADAVMHADGALASTPIALVEAQGYAYAAYRAIAELARMLGDPGLAEHARGDAEALREAFNRDFWLKDDAFYALALDGDKRASRVVTSNPAHCLWTGIVDESRAARVAARLLADDMFSGWGIRTLSANERRYNPMSYHNGSVWPHDNAIAAAGFRRYRLPEHALTLATVLFDAARTFEHARIPELFCGFTRHAEHGPVSYPVACAPQAWAAGSILQMLTALLGLDADAPQGRVTFQSPVLPGWLRTVEIHGLRVGRASLDVALSRGRDSASVDLIGRRGDVELIVRR